MRSAWQSYVVVHWHDFGESARGVELCECGYYSLNAGLWGGAGGAAYITLVFETEDFVGGGADDVGAEGAEHVGIFL
jgi:hypothetical protein